MLRTDFLVFGISSVLWTAASAQAADQLYVTTDTGTMYLLRNLQPGLSSLAAPGSMSVKTLNVDQNTDGVVPDGFTLTTLRTTPTVLGGGGQVVLGTTNGHVLTYDANLSSLRTSNTLCGDAACGMRPVQSVAVGQFGNLPVAVAAAHSLDAPIGSGGFSVVTFNTNMEFIGNTAFVDDGSGPDPDVTSLRFGNLDASRTGNELLIATTNTNTIHKNSGFFSGVAKDPASTAATPLSPQFIWDVADGNLANGIANPWFHMNNTIADAYVADSIPNSFAPTNTDEITVVGQSNDFTGPSREGPHQFGTMLHTYFSTPPGFPFFAFENAGARANQVNRPILAVVAGNILDSDPGPNGFDFTGPNELIFAGIDELRICNGFTHCTQVLSTGQRLQQIALADVLHNDGVLEIVVATSNEPFLVSPATDSTGIPFSGGRILVYEHENIGDMGSNFVFDPTAATPRGAVIELGATLSVTGLASLAATTPPGIPGDFNGDGKTDGADFLHWQRQFGGPLSGADYAAWEANFGRTGGGSAAGAQVAAPEPDCITLGVAMGGILVSARRLVRSRRIA